MRWSIKFNTQSANLDGFMFQIRLILVLDKNTKGTFQLSDLLLKRGTEGDVNYQTTNINLNLANANRFVVLMDKVYSMYHPGTPQGDTGFLTWSPSIIRSFRKFKRVNIQPIFSGATSGIGNISSGAIYCIAYKSSGQNDPQAILQWIFTVEYVIKIINFF